MKEKKKDSKKKKEGNELPEHIELQRTHVVCGTERNHHVSAGMEVFAQGLCDDVLS